MPQVLIHLSDELVNEIRKITKVRCGNRKGSLSIVIEEALERSLEPPAEISASNLLEIIDYVSRASKEGQPKDQILTNVYLMLDRQFEQSILRGLGDTKKRGRTKAVPRGVDSTDFLRKLAIEAKKRKMS